MIQKFIAKKPEQTLSITIAGSSFSFRFFMFRELLYVDITRNGRRIVTSKRVIANKWLIPAYEVENIGNIRFDTYKSDAQDYVTYLEFNTKFRLMTYSSSEIKELSL